MLLTFGFFLVCRGPGGGGALHAAGAAGGDAGAAGGVDAGERGVPRAAGALRPIDLRMDGLQKGRPAAYRDGMVCTACRLDSQHSTRLRLPRRVRCLCPVRCYGCCRGRHAVRRSKEG